VSKFFLYFNINFFILFISLSTFGQNLAPLRNYTFDQVAKNEEVNYLIIEGCVSLYSAMTELTKKKYPDLANQFFEIANTVYPYGIISLQKLRKISKRDAEMLFFEKVNKLTNKYVYEMNTIGKKTGSFFEGSFFGEDLKFCQEVTSSLNLLIQDTYEYIKSIEVLSTNTLLGHRQIFVSSMGEGRTVVEKQRKGKAIDEIKEIANKIISELN